MPEQGITLQRCAIPERHQAEAVDPFRQRDIRQIQQRWQDVDCRDRLCGLLVWFDAAAPRERRDAQPTFIESAFATAQRFDIAARSSVVRGEDQNRVLWKRGNETTNARIESFDRGRVGGVLA